MPHRIHQNLAVMRPCSANQRPIDVEQNQRWGGHH
jgi:hypothetical protein